MLVNNSNKGKICICYTPVCIFVSQLISRQSIFINLLEKCYKILNEVDKISTILGEGG